MKENSNYEYDFECFASEYLGGDLDAKVDKKYIFTTIIKEFIQFNLQNNSLKIITKSLNYENVLNFIGDNYYFDISSEALSIYTIRNNNLCREFSIKPNISAMNIAFGDIRALENISNNNDFYFAIHNLKKLKEVRIKLVNEKEFTYIRFINDINYRNDFDDYYAFDDDSKLWDW